MRLINWLCSLFNKGKSEVPEEPIKSKIVSQLDRQNTEIDSKDSKLYQGYNQKHRESREIHSFSKSSTIKPKQKSKEFQKSPNGCILCTGRNTSNDHPVTMCQKCGNLICALHDDCHVELIHYQNNCKATCKRATCLVDRDYYAFCTVDKPTRLDDKVSPWSLTSHGGTRYYAKK
jgi:hypothetical protein